MQEDKHILFLCSRNQWRSPTAEKIWSKEAGIRVRSAGLSAKARRRVSSKDIHWADVIFVVEQKHKQRLKERFRRELAGKKIVFLDIPDIYQYMDPDLVEILTSKVAPYL